MFTSVNRKSQEICCQERIEGVKGDPVIPLSQQLVQLKWREGVNAEGVQRE